MRMEDYCSEDLVNELERRMRTGSDLFYRYFNLPNKIMLYPEIKSEYCSTLKKGSQRSLALQNPSIVTDEALMWEIQARVINGSRLTYTFLNRMAQKLKADPLIFRGKKLTMEGT